MPARGRFSRYYEARMLRGLYRTDHGLSSPTSAERSDTQQAVPDTPKTPASPEATTHDNGPPDGAGSSLDAM